MKGRWAAVFSCAIVILCACKGNLQKATKPMLEKAERAWESHPVKSYDILVEVQRHDDIRRNWIIVRNRSIEDATVVYWDAKKQSWTAPQRLNESQASPFTVRGLFDTVRQELDYSGRSDIRVSMKGDPPFPQLIVLGRLQEDGEAVPESKALISVREFREVR